MRPRLGGWVAAAVALVLLAAGCVSVPTSGPVERVEGQPPTCTNCVNVEVAPPAAGDGPRELVDGFLRATSNFQPNYSVARQFLTKAAADRWTPESGVLIYTGTPRLDGNRVALVGRLLGRLAADRSYTPADQPLRIDFGLVQEAGQWRISTPPAGLPVAEYAFDSFFQPYNLYFLGNGQTLVPDPIYLPNLRNPAGIASVLIRALLNGPTRWLRPAVTTAIPAGTALSVDAVTISDGIAEIALSDPILQLNDTQRQLMTAQVVYTLQAIGIQGVRFSVNQQRFPVPQADPGTQVVSVGTSFDELSPVPAIPSDQLYAVRTRGLELVDASADVPSSKPAAGPLGTGRYRIASLAVSVGDSELAVVTDDRTVLRRAGTAGGNPVPVLEGVTDLLRPQFSRYGEIWAVADRGGRQRLWVVSGNRRQEVDLRGLGAGPISAFSISPDGSRLALIRPVGGRTQLGLASIVRADRVAVHGWRPLLLTRSNTPNLSILQDVRWSDSTDMIVLGGPSVSVPLTPYRVTQDAFKITAEGETNNWDAVGLAVSLRTQNGIIIGRDGHTWRDAGTQWVSFLDRVRALAYPG